MKRFLFFAAFVLLTGPAAFAQLTNCAQVLRLAQSTYEQGRLHELPGLMDDCFNKPEGAGGFTKQQRVDAYRYLCLAYIYLEEPEKADLAMLNLLQTDHDFEANPNVDPAEFMGLYKTYRTTPVFSIGAKFGVNGTFPIISKDYYAGADAEGKGTYGTKVAFQAGLVFEKKFFERSKSPFLKRVTFAPELLYTIRNLTYANNLVFTYDSTGTKSAGLTATIQQTWIDFNPIFQYKLNNRSLNPYIGFGPGVSYLLHAYNTPVLTREGSVGTVTGPAVESRLSYNQFLPSLIAVAGIKYKFGSIRLIAEARVQYGLSQMIDSSKRSNSELLTDYSFVISDIRQLTAMVNVGFVFPYFNPIKLSHKK